MFATSRRNTSLIARQTLHTATVLAFAMSTGRMHSNAHHTGISIPVSGGGLSGGTR